MKKLFSFVLVLIFSISIFSGLTVYTKSQELLINPGFETGDTTGYDKSYGVMGTVAKEYANTGNYGLKIANRSNAYASYQQEIFQTIKNLNGGFFSLSMYIRISDKNQPSANAYMVMCITKTDGKKSYSVSGTKALTTKYQKFNIDAVFSQSELKSIEKIAIYFQTPSTNAENKIPDVCIDDLSLIKTADKVDLNTSVLTATREEKTTVGAIRWDAWYSHDGRNGSIVSAVEKSLSPKEFHYRAPFFSEINEDNKIVMPQYTQDIFDREMEYAIYAGISYFSYVWYEGDMSMARKFHTTSKYKNDVKMCVLFDNNAIGKDYARKEMNTILNQDYYMTVLNGRPLMYYLYSGSNLSLIHDDIVYYNNLCKELNIPEPFAIIMGTSASKTKKANGNASSDYAIKASNITFNELALKTQESWEAFNKEAYQYIPCVSAGWSPEPRYHNPPFWTAANGGIADGYWCEDATSEDLFNHLTYALSYMQHDSVKLFTKANTVIIYAWNEHDEGGWICPTLKVDKNGNQLYNSDGTKKLDETRINAVKLAIDFYKQGNLVSVSSGGISNGIDLPSASSLYDNIDFLLNTKVYEGISWKNLTIETQPTPNQTAQLPETTLTPVVTPTITPTDNINSTPASTIKPTATPNSEEPQAKFPWLIVIFVAVIINAVILPITVIIKRKNGGK